MDPPGADRPWASPPRGPSPVAALLATTVLVGLLPRLGSPGLGPGPARAQATPAALPARSSVPLPASAPSDGGRCPAPPGGSLALGRLPPEARLRFLEGSLARAARRARIWTGAWGGVFSAVAVVNVGLVATDHEHRTGQGIALGASLVGVLSLALLPPRVLGDPGRLDRAVGGSPCARVASAERLLERSARDEAFGRGPLIHAGNVIFNGAVALLLGLLAREWDQAAIQMLVGSAVGEIQIFTRPRDLEPALARYREGLLPSAPSTGGAAPALGLSARF